MCECLAYDDGSQHTCEACVPLNEYAHERLKLLEPAAQEALAVLTRLADSAAYWSDYDVPVGIVSEIDAAKARLAGGALVTRPLDAARWEAEEALANVGPDLPALHRCVRALRVLLAAIEPGAGEREENGEPVSNPYTMCEEVEGLLRSVADRDCRCGLSLWDCDPCRARKLLAPPPRPAQDAGKDPDPSKCRCGHMNGKAPCSYCEEWRPAPAPSDAATKDDIRAIIGGGVHTMLRKGIDGHGSGELHRYICEMGDGGWVEMLDYWVVDPLMEELDRLRAPRAAPPATDAVREAAERLRDDLGYVNVRRVEVDHGSDVADAIRSAEALLIALADARGGAS